MKGYGLVCWCCFCICWDSAVEASSNRNRHMLVITTRSFSLTTHTVARFPHRTACLVLPCRPLTVFHCRRLIKANSIALKRGRVPNTHGLVQNLEYTFKYPAILFSLKQHGLQWFMPISLIMSWLKETICRGLHVSVTSLSNSRWIHGLLLSTAQLILGCLRVCPRLRVMKSPGDF